MPRLRLRVDPRTSDARVSTIHVSRSEDGQQWATAGAITVPPEWVESLAIPEDDSLEIEVRQDGYAIRRSTP